MDLFSPHAQTTRWWEQTRSALRTLADEGIHLGTSSWKYPGWLGWLYDEARYLTRGKFSEARFDRGCLAEYAELFPSVCVDGGYYAFPTARQIDGLVADVPSHFTFSWKVTDEITLKRYPRLDRFGSKAGQENPHFLDADLFRSAFLEPLEAHRQNIGVIMFEFSRFQPMEWSRGTDFVEALDAFFQQIPTRDWQFGVEIRNETFLHPEYFALLRRYGITHVFNSWQKMPPVQDQLALAHSLTTDFFASRLLLRPGRAYEEAVKSFSPYQKVQDPFPEARSAAIDLISQHRQGPPQRHPSPEPPQSSTSVPGSQPPAAQNSRPKRKSFLFVNNRLEGNALATITAILQGLGLVPTDMILPGQDSPAR